MTNKSTILFVVAVAVLTTAQAEFMQTRFHGPVEAVAGMAPNPPELPTAGGYNAVSTTMKCVINLTIQYMIIYSALAVARTASDGLGWKYDQVPITKILTQATLTIAYCPMAACMFLAIRMRVVWLSQGAEWDPQPWVCVCMQYVTWSILATTLVVAVIPLFTGELLSVDEKTGDLDEGTPKGLPEAEVGGFKVVAIGFTIFRYILLLGMYGGMIGVIYGAFSYMPANGQWRPMAPAVGATVTLTIIFFLVYVGVAVLRTFAQLSGMRSPKIEAVLLASTAAMNMAPMLSVLFLAARMRALQMDPVNGSPQTWAQACFYMCAYAVMFQVLFSIAVPLVLGGAVKKGKMGEGDMEYEVENKMLGMAFTIARYIMMLSIYLGFVAVIVSIFTLAHPQGVQYTPPISPTVQCVVTLTFQYFLVYLMIFVCITLKEWTGLEWSLLTDTMESARGTIAFCPMIAILFVGTRMRALQMTNNKGAPQGWAQGCMYLATWSIFLQFCMVVIAGACLGSKAETDEDGNVKWEPSNIYAFYAVQAVRWLCVLFLWGGVIGVIVSVFTITPETANGAGSTPVADVPVVGEQFSKPPPGVQSIVPGLEPGGGAEGLGEAIGGTNDYNPVTQGGNAVSSATSGH